MMETFRTGFDILLIGMSTVFVFLTIMIVVMQICAKIVAIINKYFTEEVQGNKYQTKKPDNSSEIALAIACALCKGGIKC